jgi:hypothetical protein
MANKMLLGAAIESRFRNRSIGAARWLKWRAVHKIINLNSTPELRLADELALAEIDSPPTITVGKS